MNHDLILREAASSRKGKPGLSAIERTTDSFRIADLQRECPGVCVDMIRHVLKNQREKGQVSCLGRGRNAAWKKASDGIR
jgi:hypothetical protein